MGLEGLEGFPSDCSSNHYTFRQVSNGNSTSNYWSTLRTNIISEAAGQPNLHNNAAIEFDKTNY